jgi:hypothetical protein
MGGCLWPCGFECDANTQVIHCSYYSPSRAEQLKQHFGVAQPDSPFKEETYPGDMAPLIRPPGADAVLGDRVCVLSMFGMVPH